MLQWQGNAKQREPTTVPTLLLVFHTVYNVDIIELRIPSASAATRGPHVSIEQDIVVCAKFCAFNRLDNMMRAI